MQNKTASFAVVVIIVAAVAGGALYVGRSKGSGSTEDAPKAAETTNVEDTTETSKAPEDESDVSDGYSTAYKEKLAKFLTEKGAVLYGAYWCPHCKDQKKMFGDALQYVNYVECDPAGENANPDECQARDITGYPTWVYQGNKYSGAQTLDKLAQIVGFTEDEMISETPTVEAQ